MSGTFIVGFHYWWSRDSEINKKRRLFNEFCSVYNGEGKDMKSLENGSGRIEKPRDIHRRDFFKVAGAVAGFAAVEFIMAKTGTGSLFLPREAHAQSNTRRVGDRDLRVVQLDRQLSVLDTETRPYRRAEVMPSQSNNHRYSVDVVVPDENTFLVALSRDGRRLTITLPNDTLGADLTDFASLVQNVSSAQLSRVKIVLERGTEERNGRTQSYTNAYILPINSEGNYITSLGNGEYLIHAASRRGDRVGDGTFVIRDRA
jgi:hypothetical protein